MNPFDLSGQVAVITGGSGVIGTAFCKALADAGATVAILDRAEQKAAALADEIKAAGGQAIAVPVDALNKESLAAAAQTVMEKCGRLDILINGVGGNRPDATTTAEQTFFDIPEDALKWVFDLNLMGTLLPCQVFGRLMADQKHGVILNISSMAAYTPLTRVVAYAAAKAAISNFTAWLAVTMAREYSPYIRVNAIAPGFFIGEQNRFLLLDEKTGDLTPRGKTIIDHTPMGRFGDPSDLIGTLLWLVSDASRFVTGIVVPVDGGFNAFSGV